MIGARWCRRFAIALVVALGFAIAAAPLDARVKRKTRHSRKSHHPKVAKVTKAPKIEPVRGQFLSDGVRIEEFHCTPKAAGKFPVVMLLHGCAPTHFGEVEFKSMCASLAEHDYYAMFVEYYGAAGAPNCRELAMTPSFSLAPETPIPDDRWMRELIAARNSLANNPKADSTRLGLIGFSFGGTLAVITAALNPNVVSAIVDYYGFSNTKVEDAVGRLATFPPTLILQGDADHRAHVIDSIHLHNVIEKRQPASDIRVYPRVEHGFNFHETVGYDEDASTDAWSRTLSFLDRHLK